MANELQRAFDLFSSGVPFGRRPFYTRRAPKLPARSARVAALRQLRSFLAVVPFERVMEAGTSETFTLPETRIKIDQPSVVNEADFPTLSFIPGPGVHEPFSLGPAELMDETVDVYAPGTALLRQSAYVETFNVEILAATASVRDALRAGLVQVLQFDETTLSLKLRLPAYFDRIATFALAGSVIHEDENAAKNRRKAEVQVLLTVPEVALVDVKTMRPYLSVQMVDTI